MTVPLAILDLSPISAGCDAASALRSTVDLARHAELWGYRRYWVAEHHFVAVAGSNPAVLIGQIAAATERIRVGAAAVQLGYTTAVAVVESFGILDAFHPGRIDLGLGRSGQRRREAEQSSSAEPRTQNVRNSLGGSSLNGIPPQQDWREIDGVVVPPPFDTRTLLASPRMRALATILTQPQALAPDFAEQVDDILALLDGTHTAGGFPVHAVPGEGTGLTPWIFGSSKGQSAAVAGARGLPFVASYHSTPGSALEAVEAYRAVFTPSPTLPEPYVVVSADVVVADDTATARHLAAPYGHWVYSIRAHGGAVPYPDPDDCPPLTDEQRAVVSDRIATQFVGDADEVADKLSALQRVTGADELVVTTATYRHADRLRSHELLAKRWGLPS
ncbi:LLM class flavin-dependent oxidoreductase [Candidatus Mycolicibacterium alkanivorans]|uniref:LLM class flavin-dependent oxidoreductase n=1 Tax=Candidatus Mycolicibacterium alkanivorans TaxID=2954114 RepID=A0ABS9YS99_9MYCO|nr:LLM class flavin-dependent oxidoreductase [Candidatus Mycolicibacterium alkanivorans]MCI4673699.1 LLM class flavin-dependent oxidoreductase [Candidatus Mycolicibacterium alkanivorans]